MPSAKKNRLTCVACQPLRTAKNNGKKNAVAGVGVYFGHQDERNISVRVEGKQSNNTAEVIAILKAFNILGENPRPPSRWPLGDCDGFSVCVTVC